MIAFLDANALIYLVEGNEPFSTRVRQQIAAATAVRARHGLRTSDALQAACCPQLGAQHVMLTGDPVFKRVAGLNVAVL